MEKMRIYHFRYLTMKIKTLNELNNLLESYRISSKYKFRGQSNKSWYLIPKSGRKEYKDIEDEEVFRHWKRRAKSYLKKENYTEWEMLAIAQHSGLSTRLLDWSHNPLTALFFCCIDNHDKDGALFVILNEKRIDENKGEIFKKYNSQVAYYQPSSSSNRLINQFGHFTVHYPPSNELTKESFKGELVKIIIDKNIKKEILFMLNQFGINFLTQFPDLEGLSKHLNWFFENKDYYKLPNNDVL